MTRSQSSRRLGNTCVRCEVGSRTAVDSVKGDDVVRKKRSSEEKTPDERLFPAKVAAGITSLVVMVGYFVITLTRGPNDTYTVWVGLITVGLAAGIAAALVRRSRRRRGLLR